MSDQTTTLAELREKMRRFVAERDWDTFHAPKNLAMALAIEAAELMEHFQWVTVEQSRTLGSDEPAREAIGDELADILSYLLALANSLDMDLAANFTRKLRKNEERYPAETFRGRYR